MSENDTYKMGGELPVSTVCGYLIGIYYEIDASDKTIIMEYYDSGQMVFKEKNTFDYFMNYINSLERKPRR